MAFRFGLSLAQRVGCNRLMINSDNLEFIDTMKNGGRSAGAATAIFDDCYHSACDSTSLNLDIVIGKLIE